MMLAFAFPAHAQNPFPTREVPLVNHEPDSIENGAMESPQNILHMISSAEYSPNPTSIATLLEESRTFHQQLVRIRGIIKQPELHLDDTGLKEHFVFRLTEGNQFLTVFGTHDRTQGAPFISMDQQVEVVGIFYKERILNSYPLSNLVEALTVTPYPSIEPDRT